MTTPGCNTYITMTTPGCCLCRKRYVTMTMAGCCHPRKHTHNASQWITWQGVFINVNLSLKLHCIFILHIVRQRADIYRFLSKNFLLLSSASSSTLALLDRFLEENHTVDVLNMTRQITYNHRKKAGVPWLLLSSIIQCTLLNDWRIPTCWSRTQRTLRLETRPGSRTGILTQYPVYRWMWKVGRGWRQTCAAPAGEQAPSLWQPEMGCSAELSVLNAGNTKSICKRWIGT